MSGSEVEDRRAAALAEGAVQAVHRAASAAGIELSAGQADALRALHELALVAFRTRVAAPVAADDDAPRASAPVAPPAPVPHGLYLWGDAGRGKTWLMDAFFAGLPAERVRRVHVHDALRGLHARIHANRGTESAESAVAATMAEYAEGIALLGFDEFHVHDPGDARLLTLLLQSLAAGGVTVVASSNYPPEGLLPDPMYHPIMEQGIRLIRSGMRVQELGGAEDFRRRSSSRRETGFSAGAWIRPGGELGLGLTAPLAAESASLESHGRLFPALAVRESEAGRDAELWLDAETTIRGNTSTLDYLAWAERFPLWVLAGVPVLGLRDREAQQRLINLVDVLCDRDVRTVVISEHASAEVVAALAGRPDGFRAASRLQLLRESR